MMDKPRGSFEMSPTTENHGSADEDKIAHLEKLTAQATAKYALKDYNAAAELYAYATELQADLNGEMSSANADLLYAYGRCLYHVAIRKSDVLGLSKTSEDATEAPNGPQKNAVQAQKQALKSKDSEKKQTEDSTKVVMEDQMSTANPAEETETTNKPYFQFTGDENFEDSDDEGHHDINEGDDENAVDDDDFSIAFEVLDMARLLLQKRKAEIEDTGSGKEKVEQESRELRHIMERLADTYDLQAEISLEGEKFPAAVTDLKSALQLKNGIYPFESSVIAEAHYKLSLALEFSSVTQQKDEHGETTGDVDVDEGMREEAARELESAIRSCRLRIQKEELTIESEPDIEETILKDKRTQIEDVKDMVKELSQRLVEIRQAPLSINGLTAAETLESNNPASGILGSILGDPLAIRRAKLEEASRTAQDLTGLVKKKKLAPNDGSNRSDLDHTDKAKRKLEDLAEQSEAGTEKRPRIENAEDG